MARSWLTPQNIPPNKYLVRRLFIPADYQYIEIVNGALLDLCYSSSFEQHGDATPEQCADAFSLMYSQYINPVNEPPGWGSDDDIDGSPSQPWYNDLADWIIEGFLAITGFPQAAIIYSTTIPKLRIAIQKHDLGALFKILLNNLEVYTGDSYDPIKRLLGITVDLAGFAAAHSLGDPPWQLKIVHNGAGSSLPEGNDGTLRVVRKRWTDEMPIQFRQSDPCLVEYSEDGGQTWQPAADLSLCQPSALFPIGAMIPYPVQTAPTGWLNCDGSAVSRTTYAALFAAIGTTFGSGNGTTTFNLPSTPGRELIGSGQGAGLTNRTIGEIGGEEEHVLTALEMPEHDHDMYAPRTYYGLAGGGYGVGASNYGGATTYNLRTGLAGANGAHNNMNPFLVVNFIIKY